MQLSHYFKKKIKEKTQNLSLLPQIHLIGENTLSRPNS